MGFYPGGHISRGLVSDIISLLAKRGAYFRGGGGREGLVTGGFNMGFYGI